MKLVNPWDMVYKEQGRVFSEPYKGFAKYLEILKGDGFRNILDLGCGTGRHALPLAKDGFNVYAFDISENAIKLLLETVSKNNNFQDVILRTSVADMFEKFPYPDNFFDTIISIAVVYHGTLNNILLAMKEIARVLKKGGLFYFTASVSIEHSKRVNSGKNYIMVEKGTYLPLDGREKYLVHHYFTKDELYSLLRPDFTDVSVEFDGDNYYEVYARKR